jgi:hypothetical protein
MKWSITNWRNLLGGLALLGIAWILQVPRSASVHAAPPPPCTNNCPPACTNCPPFSNSPPYSVPGLKLTIPVLTNGYIYTTVFEHDFSLAYDVYYKTNLNLTNLTIIAAAPAGETNYWITNSFSTDVFLRAISGLDSDGDGMTDGWEWIHSLNPYSATDAGQDADGDGLTNLQEFQQGSNPQQNEAWQVFIYTPRNFISQP